MQSGFGSRVELARPQIAIGRSARTRASFRPKYPMRNYLANFMHVQKLAMFGFAELSMPLFYFCHIKISQTTLYDPNAQKYVLHEIFISNIPFISKSGISA